MSIKGRMWKQSQFIIFWTLLLLLLEHPSSLWCGFTNHLICFCCSWKVIWPGCIGGDFVELNHVSAATWLIYYRRCCPHSFRSGTCIIYRTSLARPLQGYIQLFLESVAYTHWNILLTFDQQMVYSSIPYAYIIVKLFRHYHGNI